MLHAPTCESKNTNCRNPLTTAPPAPRQIGHGVAVQRQERVAHLHRSYGNGTLLRMLNTTAPVAVQRTCSCGGSGGACSCKEKEEGKLHRIAAPARSPAAAPPIVGQVLRSPGRPLDSSVRAFMEPRFGYGFGAVRIHTDALAAESARSVSALAYTVGSNIVFDHGRYAPSTADGRRTLAHELTHVVQQSHGSGRESLDRLTVSDPGDAYEKEADAQARAIDAGESGSRVRSARGAPSSLQRQTIGGPIDSKVNPCFTFPVVGQLCGQSAVDLCKKQWIPGVCDAVCKLLDCGPKKEKGPDCPNGFKAGGSTDFKGQCCKITKKGKTPDEDFVLESAQTCCTPDRIPEKAMDPNCCAQGQVPDADRKTCITPTLPKQIACPPDFEAPLSSCICFPMSRQNLLKGTCCPQGQEGWSGTCKPAPPQPVPGPSPAPTPAPAPVIIHFNLDRPRTDESGAAALGGSLTSDGKASLASLIALLKQNAGWKVELVGKASPEGTDSYNMDLSARRARLVALALQDALSTSPVSAGPDPGLPKGCQPAGSGMFACGEIGSTGPDDRQVKAIVFTPAAPATPAPNP